MQTITRHLFHPHLTLRTAQFVRKSPFRPFFHAFTTSATMSTNPAAQMDPIEEAKKRAAYKAVADHFNSNMRFVGIGSGSTIVYGVEAIKAHLEAHPASEAGHMIWFVPTGWNSRKVIEQAGLVPIAFDSLPADATLDVAFDGADEVDAEMNCIKGGGACLFQEKLVACRSKKFVCIADYRKNQPRLLTKWPSIPIEVAPIAHATVLRELKQLGSVNPKLREHSLAKTGPIQTDQSFYIIDAPFKQLLTKKDVQEGKDGSGKDGVWSVDALALRIKEISGVLEVGLFYGMNGDEAQAAGQQGGQKPVAVYFGMEDGQVHVQTPSQ
ncbi:ribose-5-phosphate isomerase [Acrodontium crateriforme]|uniref:Ribose-5-phosphate isomerase n=1 Tax=Acrodontium crateriforme TaxID=150365 RepID=A0AAQ3M9Z5_9PEZI|nr:ribose-5-phosphate isomerase [Acrodontium crateriforme]